MAKAHECLLLRRTLAGNPSAPVAFFLVFTSCDWTSSTVIASIVNGTSGRPSIYLSFLKASLSFSHDSLRKSAKLYSSPSPNSYRDSLLNAIAIVTFPFYFARAFSTVKSADVSVLFKIIRIYLISACGASLMAFRRIYAAEAFTSFRGYRVLSSLDSSLKNSF